MSIYTSVNYRKIYEDYFGPIPKDQDGRSYEVHHIDGDRTNNDPTNLMALSIHDHYALHRKQEDWAACLLIGAKLKLPYSDLTELARLNTTKQNTIRINNGTHHFLGPANNQKRVADGTHNFLGGTLQSTNNKKRVNAGTHHLLGGKVQRASTNKLLAEGRHASQIKKTCKHCGTTCSSNNFSKWHGDNCRKKAAP